MKNKFSVVAALTVLLGLATLSAGQAQSSYNFLAVYTNTALAGTNQVVPNTNIDLRAWGETALGLRIVSTNSAAVGNVTASFVRSELGTVFETTPTLTIVAALNGTNPVLVTTNTYVGAVGFYRLTSVTNAATNAVWTANVTVSRVVKPNRLGAPYDSKSTNP